MQTIVKIRAALGVVVFAGFTSVYAQGAGENIVYFGLGASKKADSVTSGDKPMSLGFLRIANGTDTVWGADFSAEGTKLDSTWGKTNDLQQATSFNLLVGKNVNAYGGGRVDASLLLGMRTKSSECPSSYLGYQCYADSEPKTSYGFNYGAVVTWSFRNLMLGLRATGESTQALVGIRF